MKKLYPTVADPRAAIFEALESRRLCSTVAYWRFEHGIPGSAATTIVDDSGNGHTGTAVGGPTYARSVAGSTVPQTKASNARSLSFNTANQRVAIPDAPGFALPKSLTVEAYINCAGPAGVQDILFRGDDRQGNDPYRLEVVSHNITFAVTNSTGSEAIVSAPFDGFFGKWTHVAGTLDNSTGKLSVFINGSNVASITTTVRAAPALTGVNPGLGIGNIQDGTFNHHFDGLIDEVRVSDVALSNRNFLNRAPVAALPPDSPGKIGGTLFNDWNGSGKLETGEARLSTWTVFLDTNENGLLDAGEKSTTTAADGTYSFNRLRPGTYHVAELVNSGWFATSRASREIVLTPGAVIAANFGLARPAKINGSVFLDANHDGVQDAGESDLSSWRVYIDTNGNGRFDSNERSAITLSNGRFSFSNVKVGVLTLGVVARTGYTATSGPLTVIAYGASVLADLKLGFALT